MAKYSIEDSTLTGIADAIREKEGTTDAIPVADFAARIAAIEGNGGGKKLSELTEGSLVSVLEDGKLVPFYVAKHNYEADLNGEGRTLLVRKDCYALQVWNNAASSAYAGSTIDTWLNGEYANKLSATVKGAMATTTFKYTIGGGNQSVTTLGRAVFLLSMTEYGLSYMSNVEGSALPTASALRVAYLNGTAIRHWTRTPVNTESQIVTFIQTNGTGGNAYYNDQLASRPCFTLPANMALNTEPYGDGSWGLADEDILFDTETATTTAKAGVNYTNGIADLAPSQLHEISAAISSNPNIIKDTSVVYYDNGDVHRKISVGDTNSIEISGESYAVNIIGFNHDDLVSGSAYGAVTVTGKAGMSFQMTNCWNTSLSMNNSTTNSTGWIGCIMRSAHLSDILASRMTAAMRSVIKSVTKLTSTGNGNSNIVTTEDKLFLLSEIEVFGSTTHSCAGEGIQYAYYKAGNSKVKKINSNTATWSERSPRGVDNKNFCVVDTYGNANYGSATGAYDVAFAYCI